MSRAKKIARSSAMAVAAAALITVALPVGNAYAINEVTCKDGAGYLDVQGHDELGGKLHDCYANAGKQNTWPSIWVDRISTGNNDVRFYDVNGDTVKINRKTVYAPKNPAHIKAIEIL